MWLFQSTLDKTMIRHKLFFVFFSSFYHLSSIFVNKQLDIQQVKVLTNDSNFQKKKNHTLCKQIQLDVAQFFTCPEKKIVAKLIQIEVFPIQILSFVYYFFILIKCFIFEEAPKI